METRCRPFGHRYQVTLFVLALAAVVVSAFAVGCSSVGPIRFAGEQEAGTVLAADASQMLLQPGELRLTIEEGTYVWAGPENPSGGGFLTLAIANEGAQPLSVCKSSIQVAPALPVARRDNYLIAPDLDNTEALLEPASGWLYLEPGETVVLPEKKFSVPPTFLTFTYRVNDREIERILRLRTKTRSVPWFFAPVIHPEQ